MGWDPHKVADLIFQGKGLPDAWGMEDIAYKPGDTAMNRFQGLGDDTGRMTYPKDKILEKLRQNREKHISEHKQALEDYVVAFRGIASEVADATMKVKDPRQLRRLVGKFDEISIPKSYADVYEEAISMIELSVGNTIEMTQQVFAQLLHNRWEWQDQFSGTVAANSVLASRYRP